MTRFSFDDPYVVDTGIATMWAVRVFWSDGTDTLAITLQLKVPVPSGHETLTKLSDNETVEVRLSSCYDFVSLRVLPRVQT